MVSAESASLPDNTARFLLDQFQVGA